ATLRASCLPHETAVRHHKNSRAPTANWERSQDVGSTRPEGRCGRQETYGVGDSGLPVHESNRDGCESRPAFEGDLRRGHRHLRPVDGSCEIACGGMATSSRGPLARENESVPADVPASSRAPTSTEYLPGRRDASSSSSRGRPRGRLEYAA